MSRRDKSRENAMTVGGGGCAFIKAKGVRELLCCEPKLL